MPTIVDSFKDMAIDPQHAQEKMQTDPNLKQITDLTNINDPNQLLQSEIVQNTFQGVQQQVGTEVVEALGIPYSYAKPLGFILPLVLILFTLYVIIKAVVKSIKAVIVIATIVTSVYIIMTFM